MSSTPRLERVLGEISRAAEYIDPNELQVQTGHAVSEFGDVVVKELTDNAIDACEDAGVTPAITATVEWRSDGSGLLRVQDNGAGIPATTVARTLDFGTRTSDKSPYRSPTRGMQGNALKTIYGLPTALCGADAEPVRITACGVRHTIALSVDPSGFVHVQHTQQNVGSTLGTTVALVLPAEAWEGSDPAWLCAEIALFNPHATVRFRCVDGGDGDTNHGYEDGAYPTDFYHPRVEWPGSAWRKWLPSDVTSPWWYDDQALLRLVYAHINDAKKGGRDLPLREFVRSFRGLSGTQVAKQVCAALPGISHLSALEGRPALVSELLQVMRQATKPPKAEVLGSVGKVPLLRGLEVKAGLSPTREWYASEQWTTADGPWLPWCCEVGILQLPDHAGCGVSYGLNFSPALGDPLAGVSLQAMNTAQAAYGSMAAGLTGLLQTYHVLGSFAPRGIRVAVHLSSPALDFMDRGKARLHVDEHSRRRIAETVWKAAKALWKEGEQQRKAYYRRSKAPTRPTEERTIIRDACYEILPAAYRAAIGNYSTVSTRKLYYTARRLVEARFGIAADKIDYGYFSQDIVPAYRREHRERNGVDPLPGIYYEPRGALVEPHTGREVALGTREVAAYAIPAHLYNKALLLEKEGHRPVFEEAGIGQRHDMAIIGTGGFATEAARNLIDRLEKEAHIDIYVLHDADPKGYNIARTLREETARMPGYSVNVVDLGLFFADAEDRGLQTETFERKRALDSTLELNERERAAFEGYWDAEKGVWICRRIELDAMDNDQMVAYVEEMLHKVGATGKVHPPRDVVLERGRGLARAARLVAIKERWLAELKGEIDTELGAWVAAQNLDDPALGATLGALIAAELVAHPQVHWTGVVRAWAERLAKEE